jgi:hypothetical protein
MKVARRFGTLLFFFSLFYRIFLFKKEIMGEYLKEIFQPHSFLFFIITEKKKRNFSIQDKIFQAKKDD